MTVPLAPATLAKIEQFSRRRRKLILLRGVCAALAILIGAMTVVAFVDWLLVLDDEIRWILSGAGYAVVLWTVWRTCARLIVRRADPKELARLIEQAEPGLREDLLSAVELGLGPSRDLWDSPVFRRLLQEDVARRMEGVRVESILSFRRIGGWVKAAAAAVAVCLVLLLLPGLRYDHLLLRSLLPLANLERVSEVEVRILEPHPAERVVPQSDPVAIRVELSGPEPSRVTLETFPAGARRDRIEMKRLEGRQYLTAIAVGREPVAYRIRAGDAITRKYVLTPRARPEVARFRKTYRFPEYALREPVVDVSESGDLSALEGTNVDLELETNQEIRSGELRLEADGKASVVPLEPGGPSVMKARIPVAASGTYRVHLVARETGFENKFSPQFEIKALPDLVPHAAIEDPAQDLTVPPEEIVILRGSAKDDLGVRKILQLVRLNGGEWKEVTLLDNLKSEQVPVARRWDLFELKVQPGDRLATKLVAVDLKGNKGESGTINVAISSPGFDPQRLIPLEAKRAVHQALVALRESVQALEKKVAETARADAGAGDLQRAQGLVSLLGEVEKLVHQADAAEERVKGALRLARPGREASDLVAASLLVRRLRDDFVASARAEIERAAGGGDPQSIRAQLKLSHDHFRGAADHALAAEEGYGEVLASEEAVAAANDLKDLARDQGNINRQAVSAAAIQDPKAWERLGRRQGVSANQARVVEELLGAVARRAEKAGFAPRFEGIRKNLEARRGEMEKALAGNPSPALGAPSQALQREVEAALAQVHPLELELARRADRAREALARKAQGSTADLSKLRKEIDGVFAAPAPDKLAPDRGAARWKNSRSQLDARAGVEEARRDSDAYFVSDLALCGRALGALLDTYLAAREAARSPETLKEVEQAFRTLEAGHGLADLSAALRELADRERWWEDPTAKNALARHPKDWAWLDARARRLPEELRQGGMPAEAVANFAKAWQGADPVRREMAERLQFGRKPGRVSEPLDRLSGGVARVGPQIQPAMEAARAVLAKFVKSLPERLRELAQASEALQKESKALAERARDESVRPEARQELDRQQTVGRQIEEIVAELRRDANVQDLFTEQGRERARDDDDAIAMLKDAPPRAEEALAEAAAAPVPKAQEEALAQAAEQQGKMAEALKQLAEHFKNAEAGQPEETRPELRKAEETLGIKEALDQQYRQIEALAELSRQSPEAIMNALENALAANEAMQRKLEQLAQNALDRAEQALQQAARDEQRVAQDLAAREKQQVQQAKSVADQAKKIAEEARQMARQDVPQAAKEAEKAKAPAARPAFQQAAQNLEEGAKAVPQDFSQPPQAAQALEQAAQELNQAAQDLKGAQEKTQQVAQQAQQAMQAAQKAAAQEQSQAQAAQQKASQEQSQAQSARQQADAAQKAAQQAQEAAQKSPQNQAAQQAAQQASQKAQAAEQAAAKETAEAQSAQQAAAKEAGEAQAAQQQAQAAQQSAQQAQAAAQRAGEEAQQAQQLAQKAQQLAGALKQQGKAQAAQLQQAAQQQGPIGQLVQQAQEQIAQAARHEERLGNPETAQALQQVAQGAEAVASNEIPAAQEAAQQARNASQAAQAAQKAIQAQADALAQARQGGTPGQPPEGPPGDPLAGLSEPAGEFLAEALDSLAQGMKEAPPGPPSTPAATQQALSSAAQAQAQAMRAARSGQAPGQQPGQSPGQQPGSQPLSKTPGPGTGAAVEAGPLQYGPLGEARLGKSGEWGKLPPKLARDLMEAQRENVSGDYRQMVETYFRVVAERAKEGKK